MDNEKDIKILNKEIGNRVWQCRLELGISRSELARKVGVTHQQFEKYEKGSNRISVGTLAAIMEYMSIDPDYFFRDVKINPYSAAQRRMCREISNNFMSIKNPSHKKLIMMASKILSESGRKKKQQDKKDDS